MSTSRVSRAWTVTQLQLRRCHHHYAQQQQQQQGLKAFHGSRRSLKRGRHFSHSVEIRGWSTTGRRRSLGCISGNGTADLEWAKGRSSRSSSKSRSRLHSSAPSAPLGLRNQGSGEGGDSEGQQQEEDGEEDGEQDGTGRGWMYSEEEEDGEGEGGRFPPASTVPQVTSVLPGSRPSRSGGAVEPGHVYFVSTPIGNLDDITLRALKVLQAVDVIASEDTRTTGRLLQLLGIERRARRLISHHAHNDTQRVPELVGLARQGKSIAVVSDAGTPGISDPGMLLAEHCGKEGVPVVPVPGACAAVAAVSVSGLPSSEWVFWGFPPSKRGASRNKKLREMAQEPRTSVFYEAPHRITSTLGELLRAAEEGGDRDAAAARPIVFGRELTKLHEEWYRGTIQSALAHLQGGGSESVRGEFTVVLGPRPAPKAPSAEAASSLVKARLSEYIGGGMKRSAAVRLAAKDLKDLGVKKAEVYAIALGMRAEEGQ